MESPKAPSMAIATQTEIRNGNPKVFETRISEELRTKRAIRKGKLSPKERRALRELRYQKKQERRRVSSGEGRFSTNRLNALIANDSFLTDFPMEKALAIRRAVGEMLGRPEIKKHYSILDAVSAKDNYKKAARNIDRFFDPEYGSIVIPASMGLGESALSKFYTPERIFRSPGQIELSGINHAVSYDTQIAPHQKFQQILNDFKDGTEALSGFNREAINNPREFFLYLGVLDYLKIHTLTLFNSLTYQERSGRLPENRYEFNRYKEMRVQTLSLMAKITRRYYQTLIGSDYDSNFDPVEANKQFIELTRYAELNDRKSREDKLIARAEPTLKYPEVTNPLVIALGAQEAVLRNPNVDIVAGIPSGGTEAAIVIQMFSKLLLNKSPGLLLIPLSMQSMQMQGELSDFLRKLYGSPDNALRGKNILLVDDNSSSAATLDFASRALIKNSAGKIFAHVAEFDKRRLTTPQRKDRTYFIADASPSTMGIIQTHRSRQNYAHRQVERNEKLANAKNQARRQRRQQNT